MEEVSRQVRELLLAELGDAQLPLAKIVPRVSTVAEALLKPDGMSQRCMVCISLGFLEPL